MAQKKHEKQAKALKRLEAESAHWINSPYSKMQISCLTKKLKATNIYDLRHCPICSIEFVKWDSDTLICPYCRKSFSGVTMNVQMLTQSFQQISESVTKMNSELSKFVRSFKT